MKKVFLVTLVLSLFLTACETMPYSSKNGIVGLPKGDFLASYESANGEYTINIYLCDGGATTDYSIRGELLTKETGHRKNVYWNYHESDAVVQWMDDETVVINDRTLNIHTDVYDFRWD